MGNACWKGLREGLIVGSGGGVLKMASWKDKCTSNGCVRLWRSEFVEMDARMPIQSGLRTLSRVVDIYVVLRKAVYSTISLHSVKRV